MALTTPDSVDEVIDRAINDVFLSLQPFGAKPSLQNSWLNSLIVAYCNRIFDFYFALDQAALEALPDTAQENLDRWAAIWGINRIAGVQASGDIVATGVLGSSIPVGTVLSIGDGKQYAVTVGASITQKLGVTITSLTQIDGVATAVTLDAHNLGSNVLVSISGATEPEYNVTLSQIAVTGSKEFTYAVDPGATSPATGSPVAAYDTAQLSIQSIEFGTEQDQPGDTVFTFEDVTVGVDSTANATNPGVGGGSDRESDDGLRNRLLFRIQNPVAHFNVSDITSLALSVPGVTRVQVEEIFPSVGDVTVYFTRDNDPTPIPDGSEIAQVKGVLDTIRPANTPTTSLIVLAPIPVVVDFVFTDIVPNTSSMKAAVVDNLTAYFEEETQVGVNVTQDAYRTVIQTTVDTTTGDKVVSFVLATPIGDIGVGVGELAVLGNVTI